MRDVVIALVYPGAVLTVGAYVAFLWWLFTRPAPPPAPEPTVTQGATYREPAPRAVEPIPERPKPSDAIGWGFVWRAVSASVAVVSLGEPDIAMWRQIACGQIVCLAMAWAVVYGARRAER